MTVVAELIGAESEWDDRSWFPPGPQLAICLTDSLSGLSDSELIEVMAAARRQTSWAQARELAAIAELSARRQAQDAADDTFRQVSEHESLIEEISAALSVTGDSAATLLHLADRLADDLPDTRAALETGRIDLPKARAIADATDALPGPVSRQIEEAVLPTAPERTTGQLRRRAKTLLQRLAPEAYEDRKATTVRRRRLEVWDGAVGTAGLGLLDIADSDAHAIHQKITAVARAAKSDGDDRPLDQIRADLATALLRGHPLPEAAAQALSADPTITPDGAPAPPAGETLVAGAAPGETVFGSTSATGIEGVTGDHTGDSVRAGRIPNDTAPPNEPAARRTPGTRPPQTAAHDATPPAADPRGNAEQHTHTPPHSTGPAERPAPSAHMEPGGLMHHGTIADRSVDRSADRSAAAYDREPTNVHGGRGTRADAVAAAEVAVGRQIADLIDRRLADLHARARRNGRLPALHRLADNAVREIERELGPFRDIWCQAGGPDPDRHGHPGYRPPAALRRLIEERHPTCVFPTCNRRAEHCDVDHTIPYGAAGGRTCRCNLAVLCRRHHRVKQSPRWRLFQPWPGVLVWITPSGTWHITLPQRP